MLKGQCSVWLAQCQCAVDGVDGKFDVQFVSIWQHLEVHVACYLNVKLPRNNIKACLNHMSSI